MRNPSILLLHAIAELEKEDSFRLPYQDDTCRGARFLTKSLHRGSPAPATQGRMGRRRAVRRTAQLESKVDTHAPERRAPQSGAGAGRSDHRRESRARGALSSGAKVEVFRKCFGGVLEVFWRCLGGVWGVPFLLASANAWDVFGGSGTGCTPFRII